jgi:alkaline phosphatase D
MRGLLHSFLFLFIFSESILSQIKSGPMLGAIELRTAYIWCEVSPSTQVKLECWKSGDKSVVPLIEDKKTDEYHYRIIEFYISNLEPGTEYEYQLVINKKDRPEFAHGKFTTQELWQYRKAAPDFSFLTGSCAFLNETKYDRAGKPYGGDSSIFESMANEKAAFMLWLGDNWYYREVDYFSEFGLWYRASKDRSNPSLQKLWKSMGHYAIWDDHDYGPNNAGYGYVFKKEAKKVFETYWCNPAKKLDHDGIYTQFSYNDVDFFLMDSRTFRASDDLKDSIQGKPNAEKNMWGREQMQWLKNQLSNSRAPFKIIANGTSILNKYNKWDCLTHYVNEYNDLMNFIIDEQIEGVLFFSGDRHHSEIVGKKLSDTYTTYDIVSSALTSGTHKPSDYEKSNPDMLTDLLVDQNNYTRVTVTGKTKERKLKIEFMDVKGNKLKEWEISENQLKFGKN